MPQKPIKFIDLFCGIGGFHYAMMQACEKAKMTCACVFASDIDAACQTAYNANFGITPHGDISTIDTQNIPEHDLLLGGFPCQAFSIIGDRKGFEDTRGTLFFNIAHILKAKKPHGFILENVKQLQKHDQGKTLKIILETCAQLGYHTTFTVLNALDFGLPQKRERIFIIGWRAPAYFEFKHQNTHAIPHTPLEQILEKNVPTKYLASTYIQEKRKQHIKKEHIPHGRDSIWHENKNGHISAHPYSCALRSGASHNYLLVNGKRRMTEREMLLLQGFPKHFKITGNYTTTKKQAGNALAVPVASEVIFQFITQTLMVRQNTTKLA